MIGKKNPCNNWAYSGIGGKIGGEMRVFTMNREQLAMHNYGVCTEPKRCILFLFYLFLKAKSTIWQCL